MAMGKFRIIGDVSVPDRTVELEGATLDDLFETAVRALCEVLADPAAVRNSVERTITLSAQEPETLFHHWLCEIVYLKDRYCEVFTEAKARVAGDGPCCVVARLRGGTSPACRPGARPGAEAASPRALRFDASGETVRARFVVPSRAMARPGAVGRGGGAS
jgi:SHS2 domain-containing protein